MKKIFIIPVFALLFSLVILLVGAGNDTSDTGKPYISYSIAGESLVPVQSGSLAETAWPQDDRSHDWARQYIGLDKLKALSTNGAGIVIAILDTGIDKNHEDLIGKVIGEANFTDSSSTEDLYGHGTFVAGIIAANDNGIGITGVAPESKLLNVKVADDYGHCRSEDLAKGVIWAADRNASVINISIQIAKTSDELESAIEYAWSKGSVIIAAAGNNIAQSVVYPAGYENVISVAATNQEGSLAPLSNYGDWVDLAAPGHSIYSLLPENGYDYETGTSFATAFVSGVAALIIDKLMDINLSGSNNDEVVETIILNIQETGDTRVKGIIDAGTIAANLG